MLFLAFMCEFGSIKTTEPDILRRLFSDGSGYRSAIAFNGILAIVLGMVGI
jgi:hypothetical protein